MKLALVGATGLVGEVMLKVLEERNLPITEFYPAASERSVGKTLVFRNKSYTLKSVQDTLDVRPDVAIFSAGATVSLEWAERFAKAGCYVVDNSSAWRTYDHVPLVVPEINAHTLSANSKIIANPNCSTIQMVVALNPLHKNYGLKRLVISTYQSVTGTGVKAVQQLDDERAGRKPQQMAYPWPIDLNCFPHGGHFMDNGYTSEEMKLVHETRKILEDQSIMITASVVRIPVKGGHSETVNIELKKPFEMNDILKLFGETPGLVIQDNVKENIYPMPRFSEGKDDVFVGRIRRDESCPNALNIWVVSDNLRKGAATNAVQIAEKLRELKLV